jgi:type IV pilus assembly protein PilC
MRLATAAAFCRRMSVSLRAGVDILRILEVETRTGDARHRAAMQTVESEVKQGSSLARAMLAEKKYFPPLLIQLVNASEIGGRLDSMFAYMADYYEQLKQTRSLFISRITWPMIQLFMAVGIVGLVILIQAILTPNTTYNASAIGLSGYSGFVTYCIIVTFTFAILGLLAYGIIKNWLNCHQLLMPLVQRIPVLGTALVTLGLSRLSMTLSMLLNAGVDAKRSVKQAFLSTGNHYFMSGMDRAVGVVSRGGGFGEAFQEADVFPQDFVDSIQVGELSGTETESLDRLAFLYQEQAKGALSNLAMIISTTIWFCIMLFIGFIIIRMAMQYINLLNNAMNF